MEHGARATVPAMANLTISVDEETLRRARIRALQRNESVNAYLPDALRRYADDVPAQHVFEELATIAEVHRTGSGAAGRGWRRQDLHRL